MPDKRIVLFGVGAVLALAAVGWYASRRVAAVVPAGAFNPLSVDNYVYRGVNEVGAVLTGNKAFSLGGSIYEQGVFQQPNVASFVADSALTLAPLNWARNWWKAESAAPADPVAVALKKSGGASGAWSASAFDPARDVTPFWYAAP